MSITVKKEMSKACNTECFGYPFRQILNDTLKIFPTTYLDFLPPSYNSSAPWSFRTRNFQSFELGIDDFLEDDVEIAKELVLGCPQILDFYII
mgnify:CR=1 FL=1